MPTQWTAHNQFITLSGTDWTWWKDGMVTRNGTPYARQSKPYSKDRFFSLIISEEGEEALPRRKDGRGYFTENRWNERDHETEEW